MWHRGLALVVVDRDREGLAMRDFLRERGFRTVVRVGGSEALRALEQEEADLIVLDCWKRPMDPLAFLRALVRRPQLRDRCLVVRAPSQTPDSDLLVRRQGARGILGRDRPLDELKAWVEETPGGRPAIDTLGRAPALSRTSGSGGQAISTPASLGPGLCIADRFVLERELGVGASAAVYLARDTELMDHVAIKVMRDSPKIRSQALRFRREAAVSRRLQHPNIVRLFEFGSWQGLLYLTMEYVAGRTLRQAIDRHSNGLPVALCLSIAKQAVAALAAAHAVGVAHRDIKPGNMMLLPNGALKLMDFGLARGSASALDGSDTRWVVGTPHYIAPERLKGAPEPCLTGDVWSLGAVLYELLCGEAPFESAELTGLLQAIINADVPPLHERRPDLPKAVCEAVMSLLQKDPADRPADLSAMARHFGFLQRALPRPS